MGDDCDIKFQGWVMDYPRKNTTILKTLIQKAKPYLTQSYNYL